jgi:D-hydroxyproline dehydrogenase subunit alpha
MTDLIESQIAVVGGGPAGIAAAVSAAESGARVTLLDDGASAGGQIWRHRRTAHPPLRARRWLARFEACGARHRRGLQVLLADARGNLLAEELDAPGRGVLIRAESLVLATGAIERFLPFPGWTLPNVIGVGAAQALVKSGLAVEGRRVVIAGSGPLLLAAAAALRSAGARIVIVAEQTSAAALRSFGLGLWRAPGKLLEAASLRARLAGTRYRAGVWVAAARGREGVREAILTDGRRRWAERCDLLCCGYGLVPNIELAAVAGCRIEQGRVAVDELQETSVSGIYAAGETTGVAGVDQSLLEGEIAGLAAAGKPERARLLAARRRRGAAFMQALGETFAPRADLRALPEPDTIVCRCEDVRFGQLDAAWSRREAKLATRAGMGPCQGKVCGPALSFLMGWDADSPRVPIRPATLGVLESADFPARLGL